MGDLAEFAPLLQLGATGVLLVFIAWMLRAIARGDWVSRRELDYVRADRDARLAEARSEVADWRAAHETSEAARELLSEHNRTLVQGFRMLDRFFDALRQVAEKDHGPPA